MRCDNRRYRTAHAESLVCVVVALFTAAIGTASDLHLVHQQRYSMGTMFDIVVFHGSAADARRAIERAMDEIVRLDQVMSHYKEDSDLAKLVRDARSGFVRVEPSLYDVIEQSLTFSRRSAGQFDVTVGPLLKAWKHAQAEGRRPSAQEIERAAGCVGYEKIQTRPPDRIRLASDCVELDLGGIGKGYAVERAIAILKSSGVEHAIVNAGGSSIAAIGAPPGKKGWPVSLGVPGGKRLFLRDNSVSTSQQNPTLPPGDGLLGEIVDPATKAPTQNSMAVTVIATSATTSDALSTTLLLLTLDEGIKLLAEFPAASVLWFSSSGRLMAQHGQPRLQVEESVPR